MKPTHRIIVHGLIKIDDKYLVIKRTKIKRGKPNMYAGYYDIPGGMVEEFELPIDALIREIKEETNLNTKVVKIIHEDSNLDVDKGIVFTRLVYMCDIENQTVNNIRLQEDEHENYLLRI